MKKIVCLFLTLATSACLANAAPLQKLTVLLDWFPNPDHAPLIIAQQQGYFKAQGLDVELISPTDPSEPPTLVAAQKADIGITYEPELMEQIDQGLPLVRIGTLIDKPLASLVALKKSGIHSLTDLKGKRIGTSNSNGLSTIILKVMLSKAGIADADVELTTINSGLNKALLTHKVDAIAGVMRNYEVPALESKHQHVTAFFPEDAGIPTYSELVFIANAKQIHDQRFPRFLAAIKEAVRYLDEHPDRAWATFAKAYPESNNAVNRDAWFATMPYFAEDPADFDSREWSQFAAFMQKNQLIKVAQPASHYAVIVR